MKRFQRILVAVDLNSPDHTVIAYARHIAELAQASRVYFFHIEEDFDLPKAILDEYPSISEPFDEFALRKMEEVVQDEFGKDCSADLHFQVGEGQRMDNLLRMSRLKDIDLIIVGTSRDEGLNDSLAEKLTRKAPCSVLIVPLGSKPTYSRVVLATDFSAHALDALDVAEAFAREKKIESFSCLHVYRVPRGYSKTGKTYEQFSEIMKQNALEDFEKFWATSASHPVAPNLDLVLDRRPDRGIVQYTAEQGTDLLIMGNRGRTDSAAILLGSVTEHVIQQIDIPLLAVKKKGENLGILKSLISIA